MLILTRRIGETLTVSDEITVTVLDVRGEQTKIGINAPKSMPVHRSEIYERIRDQGHAKEVAASTVAGEKRPTPVPASAPLVESPSVPVAFRKARRLSKVAP